MVHVSCLDFGPRIGGTSISCDGRCFEVYCASYIVSITSQELSGRFLCRSGGLYLFAASVPSHSVDAQPRYNSDQCLKISVWNVRAPARGNVLLRFPMSSE